MNRSIPLILAAILGSAIYLISARSPFLYDDVDQILFNSRLHTLHPLYDVVFCGLRQIRLIANLSFAWNWTWANGLTWPFHATNILLHIANTWFVWLFLGRMLFSAEYNPTELCYLKSFTSFLFLVHPLQAEAVSYIDGRTSLLQAMGFLVALIAFAAKKRRPLLISGVIAVSLLAKESCALIPFALLAYEMTINKKSWKAIPVKEFGLYFGAALLIMPVYFVLKDPRNMYDGTSGFSLYPTVTYLVWQARYYLFYLWIFVNQSAQSIIHVPPELSFEVYIEGFLGALVCLSALIFSWKKKLEFPVSSFLIALFFIVLSPTNSFVQMINPFAEYRLYLSNLSLFFLFSWLVLKLTLLIRHQFLKKAFIFIVACFFCFLSSLQQLTWSDELQLASKAVENYPDSYRTHLFLGGAYENRGKLDLAEEQYRSAKNLVETKETTKTYRPWMLLAQVDLKQGKIKECLEVLDSIQTKTLNVTKIPLPYYQTYLSALSQLGDKERINHMKEHALRDYPGANLP
jgi:tetratricopeptide (TPR) repeat protein